ncbi:MAG: hypothetical protein BGO61_12795 [Thiobacillus sp. 65-69]|nr:TonB family protein [Thiobacillus sp.]ODU90175.1 MAG: hypothetical protein ABT21_05825 [Thiobacillus sp. SCN 65-179]OJW38391.1 MAG: hypothetical protein BGO61_12795 [Thiobacillus sp. 65-69]
MPPAETTRAAGATPLPGHDDALKDAAPQRADAQVRPYAPLAISLALHGAALFLIAPWLVMRSIPAPPVEVEVMIEQVPPEPSRRQPRQTAQVASAVRPQTVAQAQPRPVPPPVPRPQAAPRPVPAPAPQPGQGLSGRAALAAREAPGVSVSAAAPSAAPRSQGAAALQAAGQVRPGPAQTRAPSPGSTPQPSARSLAASAPPGEDRQDGPLTLAGPAAQVQAADPEFRQAARQGGQTGMRGGSRAPDDGLARPAGSPDQTALLAARAVPPPGQGSPGTPGGQPPALAVPPTPSGAGQGRVAAAERPASDAGRLAAADPGTGGAVRQTAVAGTAERGGDGRGVARSAGPAERSSGVMQAGAPEAVGAGAAVAGGGAGASAAGEGRALQRVTGSGGVREATRPLASAAGERGSARAVPDLDAGHPSGRADGATAAQPARETRPAALQTQVAHGEARVVEERFSAPALKVDSPRSICELPLMFAGFDRKPIPKGLDSINATAASLPDETPPRHHPGNQLPRYPFQALVSRAEGRVVVRAEIQPDGQVGQTWVKQTSGAAALDQAALETVRGWRFYPAQRHGMAVAMWLDVPIEYKVPEGVIR